MTNICIYFFARFSLEPDTRSGRTCTSLAFSAFVVLSLGKAHFTDNCDCGDGEACKCIRECLHC